MHKKIVLAVVVLFVLLVAVLALLRIFPNLKSNTNIQEQEAESTQYEVSEVLIEKLNTQIKSQLSKVPQTLAKELASSRIYFMLSPKTEPGVQTFVLENNVFSSVQPKTEDDGDLYYSYSSDGNKATFFAIPDGLENFKGNWGSEARLYVADTTGGTHASFPELSSATIVDASDIPFKQYPDVSNSGDVLFIGWEGEKSPEVEFADNYSIYHTHNGVTTRLFDGYFPRWVSDTEFFFLKNDGLYLADINSLKFRPVSTTTGFVVSSNNRIDVSDDGRLLSWVQPDLQKLLVYQILDKYALEFKTSISTKGFWNMFSPSGNYLAVQTIELSADGREEQPYPKIEFFDTNTFKKVPELEIDMSAFIAMSLWLNDWTQK